MHSEKPSRPRQPEIARDAGNRPAASVYGRMADERVRIAQVRARTDLIPNARFELVPGGHEPWLEDLQSTAKPIASFLEENRTPPPALSEEFDMARA